MSAVKGKDILISIDDGSGTMLEVEYQNDATFNSGKAQEKARSKNGTLPYQTEEGATITFDFNKVRPLSAGQNRLYALSDSGETAALTYDDENTGGHKIAGDVNVTISEESSGTDGVVSISVVIAFADDPVRTVNT
ncbi:hypothetical protein GN241_11045 [Rhodobacteraceae bacterium IMCC1335]